MSVFLVLLNIFSFLIRSCRVDRYSRRYIQQILSSYSLILFLEVLKQVGKLIHFVASSSCRYHDHPNLYVSQYYVQASSQNGGSGTIVPAQAQFQLGTSHTPLNFQASQAMQLFSKRFPCRQKVENVPHPVVHFQKLFRKVEKLKSGYDATGQSTRLLHLLG